MAKISVSLSDDLASELREEDVGNVSRFVSSAVRDALDRRRLLRALAALDADLGPVHPDLIEQAEAAFSAVEAENERRTAYRVEADSKTAKRSRSGRATVAKMAKVSATSAKEAAAKPAARRSTSKRSG